jgi:hypothetical protein
VPGCPEQGFLSGLLSSCKAIVARADRQAFKQKLVATLLDLLKREAHYDNSAIIETVRTVVAGNRNADPTRLVIFSDMLENSDLLTLGRLGQDGAARSVERIEAEKMLPDVEGLDVDAFGIGRSHAPGRPALSSSTSRELEAFWTGLFQAGGASRVSIGPEYSGEGNGA